MTENETPIEQISDADMSPPACGGGEEIIALQTQLAEMTDKYLRTAAELENTRRRAEIDATAQSRNRAISVARDFLPLVDAIVAAEKHDPADTGIQTMARALDTVLAGLNIKKIESVGAPLNPQFHNAIQVIESADAAPNTIVDEMQDGYMFGDTLLRPAMVVVAK